MRQKVQVCNVPSTCVVTNLPPHKNNTSAREGFLEFIAERCFCHSTYYYEYEFDAGDRCYSTTTWCPSNMTHMPRIWVCSSLILFVHTSFFTVICLKVSLPKHELSRRNSFGSHKAFVNQISKGAPIKNWSCRSSHVTSLRTSHVDLCVFYWFNIQFVILHVAFLESHLLAFWQRWRKPESAIPASTKQTENAELNSTLLASAT